MSEERELSKKVTIYARDKSSGKVGAVDMTDNLTVFTIQRRDDIKLIAFVDKAFIGRVFQVVLTIVLCLAFGVMLFMGLSGQ